MFTLAEEHRCLHWWRNIVVYIGGGTTLSKLAEEDDSGELKKRKLDKTLGLPLAALGETIQEEGRYLELYYR